MVSFPWAARGRRLGHRRLDGRRTRHAAADHRPRTPTRGRPCCEPPHASPHLTARMPTHARTAAAAAQAARAGVARAHDLRATGFDGALRRGRRCRARRHVATAARPRRDNRARTAAGLRGRAAGEGARLLATLSTATLDRAGNCTRTAGSCPRARVNGPAWLPWARRRWSLVHRCRRQPECAPCAAAMRDSFSRPRWSSTRARRCTAASPWPGRGQAWGALAARGPDGSRWAVAAFTGPGDRIPAPPVAALAGRGRGTGFRSSRWPVHRARGRDRRRGRCTGTAGRAHPAALTVTADVTAPTRAPSALVAVIDRAPALQSARFDLDVEALAQQVLQGQHLAGSQQRHAEADVQPRRQLLADAEHAATQRT